MQVIHAKFFQAKKAKEKGKFNGFFVEEKTNLVITDSNIYWWLMLNIYDWIIKHTYASDKFDLSKPVDILLHINATKRHYRFYRTTKDSVPSIDIWGLKYTIEDVQNTSINAPSNLHRLVNFIEYSNDRKGGLASPEISTPMRD